MQRLYKRDDCLLRFPVHTFQIDNEDYTGGIAEGVNVYVENVRTGKKVVLSWDLLLMEARRLENDLDVKEVYKEVRNAGRKSKRRRVSRSYT